jgi:hypothetical protein
VLALRLTAPTYGVKKWEKRFETYQRQPQARWSENGSVPPARCGMACGGGCGTAMSRVCIVQHISAPDGSPTATPPTAYHRRTHRRTSALPGKVRPPIRRHDGAPKLISPSISSTQHIPFPHVTRNSKMERHALGPFTPPRLLALAPSSSFPLLPLGMIAPSLPARSSHNGRTSGAHQ